MRVLLIPLILGGCSQFGAQSVFTELEKMSPAMLERSAMCQMIEGQASADGVYSNGSAQIVSVVEFNGGCSKVTQLETRNGAVSFQ